MRNRLSHNETFTYDDAERALDTMRRLLESVSAKETAEKISASRDTILRTKYADLARNEERRKTARLDISVDAVGGLLPWRDVVEPHQDVATGEFEQAEFAADKFHHRDNTLKQFAKLYRENANDFPNGCSDEDYRRKLEKAYPIHPELFDQLYTSWGSLEKFQRTRGVLRLMAQVIHELWMGNDPSVMIMPGSVAISSARVEPELLRYLDPSWQSIIAGDVDGVSSTPYKIDQSGPNLNRYSATCRVARAVFMGTSPTHGRENKGLDDKQINLGVVQPGERPAIFGDALRRLANQAKFMHSDLGRYRASSRSWLSAPRR